MKKPHTFLFFGRSGSGKGTQAEMLIEYLKQNDKREVLYIETGQRFRKFLEEKNYTSKLVSKTFEEGGLLPAFLPVWIWTDAFVKCFSGEEHLVLDGLSRREMEAPILDSALSFYGITEPYVVYIETSRKWCMERLKERGRKDDHEKEIEKRMDWYEKNVIPAIQYFDENSRYRFIKVNGERTIDEIHEDIIRELKL